MFWQMPRHRTIHRPRASLGFTLVELLTGVTVMAVLASVTVPFVTTMIDSIKLTSLANGFMAHLHLARNEAIKRNTRVVLCKSATGDSCAATGGWEQGWIVFQDSNDNGVVDAGEAIIERMQALPASFRLVGNQNVAKYVSFDPSGATKLVSGAFQAGTLTLCRLPGATEGRQIILNSVGRPRMQKAAAGSCL